MKRKYNQEVENFKFNFLDSKTFTKTFEEMWLLGENQKEITNENSKN